MSKRLLFSYSSKNNTYLRVRVNLRFVVGILQKYQFSIFLENTYRQFSLLKGQRVKIVQYVVCNKLTIICNNAQTLDTKHYSL